MRSLIALLLLSGLAQIPGATPIPRFTDPERRAKLEAALPEIDKLFERFHEQRRTPGLVYGVVIDGEPVVIKSFGLRDLESKDPVTANTRFRIASMTKSFTALAILKLRDEGKLSLEDPVAKWIPEFADIKYPTSDTAPIRVRQLLTHGAGFPEDNPWGDRQLGIADQTMTKWLRTGLPFSTPPNTEFEYSNYGFALLGRIVAKASKMPYKDYLTQQILIPLGMKDSTLEPTEVPEGSRATGYRLAGQTYEEEKPLSHGAFGAMGGLVTTANDLARYVAYHVSAYPPRDGPESGPVRRSSVREMQSLARPSGFRADHPAGGSLRASAGGYGYGLSVNRDCRFAHIVGHGGGLPGFGSYMQWLPEYGAGMFAMANLTYTAPSGPLNEAWDVLAKTGALKPRELPVSTALITARDWIVRLWNGWDNREADEIAADNLFLDRAAEERRKEMERLKESLGKCEPPGEVEPENLLRGTFRMTCEKGVGQVRFTLAPTMPPKVQALSFSRASEREPSRTPGGCALQ
jgi:CubicO group peptidase (beta-lactamase class C family)